MSPNAIITFPLFGDGFVLDIPRYFTIFGFNVYYYGLLIVAGYTLAGIYLIKRRKLFGLTQDNVYDLVIMAILCGLVGARLYYMFFNFDRFFAPGEWGNILRFRDGGLAVYGGIIASGIVFIVYSRVKKIPLGNLLDAAGFGLFIGQAVGRWGNFINREAYGVETDMPWRMGLTEHGITRYYHPAFLYESLWNATGLLLMHIFSKKSKTKYPGQYFLFYVAWYGLGRFIIEGLRTDSLLIPGTDMRASQWLAAFSFLVAMGIIAYNHIYEKEAEPVYGEDAEELEEYDSTEELVELDGVTLEDIAKESKDEDADDGEDDSEDEDDVEIDSEDEEDAGIDPEDEESAEELAGLDGVTLDDVDAESEDDDGVELESEVEDNNDENIEEE